MVKTRGKKKRKVIYVHNFIVVSHNDIVNVGVHLFLVCLLYGVGKRGVDWYREKEESREKTQRILKLK